MRAGAQLLTYPDSLGGDLASIRALLDGPLAGLFGGVHILPPFPSSADRGFAPVTYGEIDPRFGDWDDIAALAAGHDVLLDLMVNHISRQSDEFRDFQRYGRRSRWADLFITLDKVWPDGHPPADDVARIFLRKPDHPFSTITIGDSGEQETVWTSFGTADWSEQVDLDLRAPATRALITDWLRSLASRGVRIVRLDAVGYVVKRAGTSCFMVEPEIWEVMDWLGGVVDTLGLILLPEVHDVYATHEKLTSHGYWTYDFVLPGLLLHAFASGDATRLTAHLARSPERQFTTLDCHDGIPVRPDLDGILEPHEMLRLAEGVLARGGNVNRILSDSHAGGVDVHQLNCTYYSALDEDDDRYVAARAIQLFARGVPQVYYVGLLAGANDHAAVDSSGEGRAINRHDYTLTEIEPALRRPVVRRVLELIRLRATHRAFGGRLAVETPDGSSLRMSWSEGEDTCTLEVDMVTGASRISTRPLAALHQGETVRRLGDGGKSGPPVEP
jgi:sucrose 6(F)-phosphate phosphorylase